MALILSGAILVALGLGPAVSTGVGDILNNGAVSITVTNLVIGALALCIAGSGLYWIRGDGSVSAMAGSRVSVFLIVSGAAAIAVFSFIISKVDNSNSAAWRYASSVSAEQGVSKAALTEYGHHYARFTTDGSAARGETIGRSTVSWATWAGGGEWEFLVRMHALAGSDSGSICSDARFLTLAAVSRDQSVAEATIPTAGSCGRWERIRLEIPHGADALRIAVEPGQSGAEFAVDVLPVRSRANLSWAWNFCVVLAITALLFVVFVASNRLKSTEVAPLQEGQRGIKACCSASTGLALLLFLLLGNAFVYWFVDQEKTIYTWDNAGYWTSTRNVSEFIQGAERKSVVRQASDLSIDAADQAIAGRGEAVPAPPAIAALVRNIRFAEYNVTTSLAVAPVMAVFGGSRMVYELSLLNIYAFAAVLMLILAVRAGGGADAVRWPAWWPLIPVLSVVFFVPFWVPLVRGYMGISIVGLNLAVLWLYFRQPVRSASTASLIAIGVLLVAGVFLQRWNAYWVIGFFVLAFADSVNEFWRWRGNQEIGVLHCFRAPLVAGFTAFFIFSAVAWPKIVTMATTDYADIFSAYLEHTSLFTAFVRLVSAFGLLLVVAIFLSIAYLATTRSTRRIALLLSAQIIYIFVHMSSTQTMGPHHLYLLMPAMLSLLGVAALHSMSRTNRSVVAGGAAASLLFVVSGLASGASVFVPSDNKFARPSSIGIISQDYRPPLVRQDLDEFVRLAEYVGSILGEESPAARLYVLAGSQTLNAEHFGNISASTGIDFGLEDRVLPTAVVDKRDGFPEQILHAQLVVTSDPIQLSRRPSDQQVIRIPAEGLLAGRHIGAAFERMPVTFKLDDSLDVIVFRRTRSNSADEIAELSELLKHYYPDRPYIYE